MSRISVKKIQSIIPKLQLFCFLAEGTGVSVPRGPSVPWGHCSHPASDQSLATTGVSFLVDTWEIPTVEFPTSLDQKILRAVRIYQSDFLRWWKCNWGTWTMCFPQRDTWTSHLPPKDWFSEWACLLVSHSIWVYEGCTPALWWCREAHSA